MASYNVNDDVVVVNVDVAAVAPSSPNLLQL